MIYLDWPLGVTAILFFALSWGYGWGLYHFYGEDFAWDLAAVTGIFCVVTAVLLLVWLPRLAIGYIGSVPIALVQFYYDLAIVFAAALPGMTLHRHKLKRLRGCRHQTELEEIREMAEQALSNHRDMQDALTEILELTRLRQQAIEYLRDREVFKN